MKSKQIELKPILYVFGGEKAQGAEIVIERLITDNSSTVDAHLILAPGSFATTLQNQRKPYHIQVLPALKKLHRSSTGKLNFILKGIANHFKVSYQIHCYIKKFKIKTVHANTVVPAAYLIPLILYSRIFNQSVQWLWSDHDMRYFGKLDKFLSIICSKLYDYTLVVSLAVKGKYSPSKKIIVLYNGLDTDIYKPDPGLRESFRNAYQISESTVIIGMAASITPDKGQLDLIEAFQSLRLIHPDVKLFLAGGFAADTPDYNQLVQSAIKNDQNIIYLGFFEKMLAFNNGCDIIVNNSNRYRSESLGTTIYEAMACEKVVVAAATGGTPEIITDRLDGFLFPAENISGLFNQLKLLCEEVNLLPAIRTAARRKVFEKFDIHIMRQRYNEIIR